MAKKYHPDINKEPGAEEKFKEINEAYDTLDDNLLEALKKAAANIEKFHKQEIPEEWNIEVREGITAGQIVRPINSVGCYIPGGRAAYPSTILMTVIPAKIAGVKKIICLIRKRTLLI